MQITYVYEGQPRVSLIVDIPKLRKDELEPKRVWEIRKDLRTIIRAITNESRANPQSFATQLFKTVKAEYQTIVLMAVVFTVRHEEPYEGTSVMSYGGETVLTYTATDVDLS